MTTLNPNVLIGGAPAQLKRPFLCPRYDDNYYITTQRILAILGTGILPLAAVNTLIGLPGWGVDPGGAVNVYLTGQYLKALDIRRICHEMQAIFSGRAPQCNGWTPGGVTTSFTAADVANAQAKINTIKAFVSTEIAARNKELDDFTYVVSHDLKEPLISVEGYAKIIKQQISATSDPSTFEYIGSIIASCSHMKGLIDDLLQLSRVSRVSEEMVSVDLGELVAQVLSEMQFFIKERGAVVDVQQSMPVVRGVVTHLKIVFRNLLSNAIKFCDKSVPRVEIRAEAGPRAVTISVKDNGMGIPKEYREHVFLIFQRLHKHDAYEGTGAGLTIVKKIVESHGGKIWVDSEPGQWTVFTFTLHP